MSENFLKRLAPKYRYLLLVAPPMILLDQYTKLWIVANLEYRDRIVILKNFFNLSHVHNTGMIFGKMGHMGPWFFILLSAVAFAVLVYLFRQIEANQRRLSMSVAFIFSGAVGNLIDRVRLGYVIDFLDMYVTTTEMVNGVPLFNEHHWPSYNVADICICIGAGLLALEMFFGQPPQGETKNEAPPTDDASSE